MILGILKTLLAIGIIALVFSLPIIAVYVTYERLWPWIQSKFIQV